MALLAMITGSQLVFPAPALAANVAVWVGYADDLRANPTNFPTPWLGSPNTTFEGCIPASGSPCDYDGGSIRVVNNGTTAVTVDAVALHIDTCTYSGWPAAALAPGADLIVAQLGSGAADGCTGPTPATMDTSDIGPANSGYSGNCTPDGIQPVVDVTIDGNTTSYTESGQVLNTGGIDAASCPSGAPTQNESIQWTPIGHAPCNGSSLTLTPASQTDGLGVNASLTATFTNGCGDPLSDVAVNFAAQSGPNAGRTGTATTDANGQATVTYTSTQTGTDLWGADVQNVAGEISSNNATVTWVAFAGGGGAFVISDLKAAQAETPQSAVYWWGAQWWKKDPMSTGLAPASFKGYENGNPSPWCGETWTTRPGNSPHPPQTVPATMAVIVSSHITKKGPVITGDVVGIVLVSTKPGYAANPGHPGTGTVIETLCSSSSAMALRPQAGSKPVVRVNRRDPDLTSGVLRATTPSAHASTRAHAADNPRRLRNLA